MRCPHCAGECPDDAAFCGICGHRVTGPVSQAAAHRGSAAAAGNASGVGADVSMSLFDLPVSRGARAARIAAVVALNAVLASAGIAMIASYFRDRAAVLERFETGANEGDGPAGKPAVEIQSPVAPVPVPETAVGDKATSGADTSTAGAAKSGGSSRAARSARVVKEVQRTRPSSSGAGAPAKGSQPGVAPSGSTTAGPTADDTLGSDPRDHDVVAEQPSPEEVIRSLSARVGRVVDRHRVQLQRCYQQATKTEAPGAPLSGRIEVRFAIMPDGTASDVSVPVNTSGSDRLADCVSASVAGWALPTPGDEPVVLQWPFVFTAPPAK